MSEVKNLSHSVVSNSLRSHGWWSARLLCPWNPPGRNTGVGKLFPSPDLPNPGIELRSSALQADSLLFEPPGKPPPGSDSLPFVTFNLCFQSPPLCGL